MSKIPKLAGQVLREAILAEAAKDAIPSEIPFAYAIVQNASGGWLAVCLEGVTAREVVRLEPNGDAEPQARAMMRVNRAIELRTIAKKWGKP